MPLDQVPDIESLEFVDRIIIDPFDPCIRTPPGPEIVVFPCPSLLKKDYIKKI
jgi:hypothetical protein